MEQCPWIQALQLPVNSRKGTKQEQEQNQKWNNGNTGSTCMGLGYIVWHRFRVFSFPRLQLLPAASAGIWMRACFADPTRSQTRLLPPSHVGSYVNCPRDNPLIYHPISDKSSSNAWIYLRPPPICASLSPRWRAMH